MSFLHFCVFARQFLYIGVFSYGLFLGEVRRGEGGAVGDVV